MSTDNSNRQTFPSIKGIEETGLTKREYFAGVAMAGLLANPKMENYPGNGDKFRQHAIQACMAMADELLKQLENDR